jgi:hypothetical protein
MATPTSVATTHRLSRDQGSARLDRDVALLDRAQNRPLYHPLYQHRLSQP